MKIDAQTLYNKLVNEYHLIGKTGGISFRIDDFTINIESKDSVGNLLQEWLEAWMVSQGITFEVNPNSQVFPDIYLDSDDKTKGLLEIKAFDIERGPGFDLANFDSYCNSLLENAYRLDSDYLILAYKMEGAIIRIENVWLKKIWEIAGGSSTYPVKVQEKKSIIYNLRPIIWYSERSQFKAFESKEAFLAALNNTRHQYAQTRPQNSHWLRRVIANYRSYTGIELDVLR